VANPKVFLSYARADDETFAKRLRDDLDARNVDVWWDCTSMRNRGRTFLQELRDAIEGADRLIAIIGPGAVVSDNVQSEWEHAQLFAKGIVPVLRKGDWSLAPVLGKLDGPDMKSDLDYESGLDKLVNHIHELIPPLAPWLTSVPSLPPRFQPRPEDMSGLNALVLPDIDRPVVVAPPEQITVLHGMGGIGKSVLAAAFCRTIKVRRALSDGIAWLSIGRDADLLASLRILGQGLGDDPRAYFDLEVAKARLPACMKEKKCLIVLDDVWDVSNATPFLNALGPQSRILITTRDAGLLSGTQALPIGEMSSLAALRLLADWCGEPVDALPPATSEVARECGNHPFALALCGAMRLEASTPWEEMLEALREADLTFLEHKFPNYEAYSTVLRSLQVSVDALTQEDPEATERYRQLAVFGFEEAIPEVAVLILWTDTSANFKDRHARKLLNTLARKALISLTGAASSRQVSMHDLQRDYLHSTTPDKCDIHRTLLARYQARCQEGAWWTGPDDGYFFERLPIHLKDAGQEAELADLLFDCRWLDAKLKATSVNAVADDYRLLKGSPEALLVQDAIRLSNDALLRDSSHLAGQLFGRLMSQDAGRIHQLLGTAAKSTADRWFRPIRPALTPAGTPLLWWLKTLDMSIITSLALSSDSTLALCSDEGYRLHIWNLVTGSREGTLKLDDDEWVTCMQTLSDGAWVLCGTDRGRILLLDLATGEFVRQSEPVGQGFEAIAVSRDARVAVSGDSNGLVYVWEVETGELSRKIDTSVVDVESIAIAPDGASVFVAGDTLEAWSLVGDEPAREFAHPGLRRPKPRSRRGARRQRSRLRGIYSIEFSQDGSHLAIGMKSGALLLLDTASGEVRTFREPQDDTSGGEISCVRFSVDGSRVISSGWDGALRWWSVEDGSEQEHLEAHAAPIYDFNHCRGGSTVVTGSKDGSLKVWDLRNVQSAVPVEKHRWSVCAIVAAPEEGLAFSGSQAAGIKAWCLATGDLVWSTGDEDEAESRIDGVGVLAHDPEKGRIVAAYGRGRIRCLDWKSGEPLAEVTPDWKNQFPALAIAEDGKTLVAAFNEVMGEGTDIWRVGSEEKSQSLPGVFGNLFSMDTTVLSHDGQLAAIDLLETGVQIVDLETGTILWTLETDRPQTPRGNVSALVLGGGKQRLAVGFASGLLEVWDLSQRSLIRRIEGFHREGVSGVSLSHDETMALSISADCSLRLWEVSSGALIASYICDEGWSCCSIIGQGERVVAGDFGGNVHLLELCQADSTKP
jgi:WD40 repeat protein